MFKSKFANALTAMMIGSLGIAAAENRKFPSGTAPKAGEMDALLARLCARYCKSVADPNAQRSVASLILSALGVPSELGTDTAWTFEPLPPEVGRKALADAGWDGRAPILVVCPIHRLTGGRR